MTLIELIMAIAILLVLSTAAIPIFRNTVIRRKESELRRDLREMRKAIDHYKDMADRNLIASEFGSQGYPKDLDTLVKGVPGATPDAPRTRFLRRIPVDPMIGKAEWDMQSIDDDPIRTALGDTVCLMSIRSRRPWPSTARPIPNGERLISKDGMTLSPVGAWSLVEELPWEWRDRLIFQPTICCLLSFPVCSVWDY